VRLPSSALAAGRAAALATALAGLVALSASAQPARSGPDDATVARAMEQVKADPNVATSRTIKSLRWKDSTEKPKPREPSAWRDWLTGFFRWVDQSARVAAWVVVSGLVAVLAFYIVRTLRSWDETPGDADFVAPTHVHDLDIRPESLPADIGASARRLWDRGEHRSALSLLYRGLLSRLAHVHRLPVRDSSTEGDCLALSARMGAAGRDYAGRLIGLWQAAVYGHLDAETAAVHALCDSFAPALDAPPAGES
jgi:hypothetical protein